MTIHYKLLYYCILCCNHKISCMSCSITFVSLLLKSYILIQNVNIANTNWQWQTWQTVTTGEVSNNVNMRNISLHLCSTAHSHLWLCSLSLVPLNLQMHMDHMKSNRNTKPVMTVWYWELSNNRAVSICYFSYGRKKGIVNNAWRVINQGKLACCQVV